MAIPEGCGSTIITFGTTSTGATGAERGSRVQVTPGSYFVWGPTGQEFIPETETFTALQGNSGLFTVINPDQDFFEDGNKNSIRGWGLTVKKTWLDANNKPMSDPKPVVKNIALTAADIGQTLDLEEMMAVSSTTGQIIYISATLAEQVEAATAAADAAAASLAGFVAQTDPAVKAALALPNSASAAEIARQASDGTTPLGTALSATFPTFQTTRGIALVNALIFGA